MRTDPRVRQSLNRISTSLEDAADNARTGCFQFTKSYIEPCLSSINACYATFLPPPPRRHHHHRSRSEYPFGFYDYDDSDDEDQRHGFLAWGNGELDRLLAGGGREPQGMYYGISSPTGAGPSGGRPGMGAMGRRKSTLPGRASPDPTVIPGTSMFGFLAKLGFRGKGMRYKPSAANLQEHPQRVGGIAAANGGRKRSGTNSSGGEESLRSRGDLWPSEDEDDAVVIGDDAFPRSSDGESAEIMSPDVRDDESLRQEEEALKDEEEREVERKREAARRLAVKRGLKLESHNRADRSKKKNHSAPPSILARSLSPGPPPAPSPLAAAEILEADDVDITPTVRKEKEDSDSSIMPRLDFVTTESITTSTTPQQAEREAMQPHHRTESATPPKSTTTNQETVHRPRAYTNPEIQRPPSDIMEEDEA